MNGQADDLAAVVRLALEPSDGSWLLCRDCGTVKHSQEAHICRQGPVEAEGMVNDDKRRAKSYAV